MIEPSTTPPKLQKVKTLITRKPLALFTAGALGLGLAASALAPHVPDAFAQTTLQKSSAVTPFANAPASFADLAEKVTPSVVSIQVKNGSKRTQTSRNNPEFNMPDLPDGHPLKEFFKRFGDQAPGTPERGPRRRSMSQGSGFIITSDGFVVTNHHVVNEAEEIIVSMNDGDEHKAEIIGSDERTDLALLKIKTKKQFPYVEFADKTARVGDWVMAVGNPFGLGGTVTAGIVSAHNRDIGNGPYDFLQIDAAVNRGNSGGPAFNLQGKVIGVNTAIFSPSGGNVGIAFAVPSTLAKQVVTQLKSAGKVARGWLGVTIQNVSEDIAASLGIDEPKGALVTKFAEGAPAAKSDMKVGDLILEVDGSKIDDSRDLARKIAGYTPNSSINVTVLRDGKERDVKVKLGTFPSGKKLAALQRGEPAKPSSEDVEDLGLSLAPASSRPGSGDTGVVIVEVDPDSDAADKGLKAGDVILEVAGKKVKKPSDVAENIANVKNKGRPAVHMLVRSGDNQRFVALQLKKT